ncbi:hypothetical protein PISMIDRAFT_681977, partial [Pisolithus microcarpus 441]
MGGSSAIRSIFFRTFSEVRKPKHTRCISLPPFDTFVAAVRFTTTSLGTSPC